MAKSITVEADGKTYAVELTTARLGIYEKYHPPVIKNIASQGWFSVAELIDILACGLLDDEGNHVALGKAQKIVGKVLKNLGYMDAHNVVHRALSRDCAFLYKAPQSATPTDD